MSISSSASLFGSALLLPVPAKPSSTSSSFYNPINGSGNGGGEVKLGTAGRGGLVIECSSRPQKKATKHHMKTRPKKSQPWDIRRKPTVYPPLPPLPPDWTIVSSADGATVGSEAALPSGPALQAPVPGG